MSSVPRNRGSVPRRMGSVARRVGSVARRLLGRTAPVILMYHRVASARVDPWDLAVDPENFAAQMRLLQERRKPIPLDDMVEALLEGRCPPNAVAVTFDDAYRDVLENAKPVLDALEIPATVFVVTGLLGSPQGFWWDRLAVTLFEASSLPPELDLSFVPLASRTDIAANLAAALHNGDRAALHLGLWSILRLLPAEEREEGMKEIAATLGDPGPADAPVMTRDEVLELIEGGRITVGAHTVTHPSLSHLSVHDQRTEMARSRRDLEELTHQTIRRFSYPFGDLDEHSEALAEEVGFRYAVGVEPGRVSDPGARFRLPRIHVRNESGQEFAKRLAWIN